MAMFRQHPQAPFSHLLQDISARLLRPAISPESPRCRGVQWLIVTVIDSWSNGYIGTIWIVAVMRKAILPFQASDRGRN